MSWKRKVEKLPFFWYNQTVMAQKNTLTPITVLFVQWYYFEAPLSFIRGYFAYAKAISEIVPFVFLFRTLLLPWKNIADRTRMRGIDLTRIMEKLSLGLLACGVGFVVRVLTICMGLLAQFLLLTFVLTYLAVWLLFPALFLLGIGTCIQSL